MPSVQNKDIKCERKKKPGLANFPSGRPTRIDLSSLSGRHVHVSWITQARPGDDPSTAPPPVSTICFGWATQANQLGWPTRSLTHAACQKQDRCPPIPPVPTPADPFGPPPPPRCIAVTLSELSRTRRPNFFRLPPLPVPRGFNFTDVGSIAFAFRSKRPTN